MIINIEIAGPGDAPQLAALHFLSHKTAFAQFADPDWVANLKLADYERRWQDSFPVSTGDATPPRSRTWKATSPETGDEVIGMVRVAEMSEHEAQLMSMHVHPDHHRRGIGSLLMDRAMSFIHEAGFHKAQLGVIQANVAARALYEQRGWEVDELHDKGTEGVPIAVYRLSPKAMR